MNREEAERRRSELAAEDPGHTWLVRARGDGFEVVKVGLPGPKRPKLTPTTEAAPKPGADDPRTAVERLIPPFGPPLG
jgi:hypothetical protein